MSLLSMPLTEMQAEYDAIVVGTGYGGAISAATLARTRRPDGTPLRVAVLERGEEIPVGRFPADTLSAAPQFQVRTGLGEVGDDNGLYYFHVDDDVTVLQGCGLGGTSLINANVSVPPDPRVFDDPRWPSAIRDDGLLAQGMDRARDVLCPKQYPDTGNHPELLKYKALQTSGKHLGKPAEHVPINVTFEDGVNPSGVEQRACTGCGDCVSGCNFAAKNTLMMNYLPEARADGAELFCGADVHRVAKGADGRWLIHYQPVGYGRDRFAAPTQVVSAPIVVLAAGSLGSTGILLRSRPGLTCSTRVGASFTGNGDVLGFGYNGDKPINGVGVGPKIAGTKEPVGPTITGVIDMRDTPELDEGLFIEEGALPSALRPLLPTALALSAPIVGEDTSRRFWDEAQELQRILQSELAGASVGAMHNTQTYLVMAHDGGDGVIELDAKGRVRVRWPGVGKKPLFKRTYETLRKACEPNEATMIPSPLFNRALGYDVITVHPLGGCPMAEDAAEGVVNDRGLVFACESGTDVHDGLYVLDGSIVPRPLGVNPLLTISALAERGSHLIASDRDWKIVDRPPQRDPLDLGEPQPHTALWFTERLAGFVSTAPDALADPPADDPNAPHRAGEAAGREDDLRCAIVVTIRTSDVERFSKDPNQEADVMGTVEAPAIDPDPMTVDRGRFNLLVPVGQSQAYKRMHYRLPVVTIGGRRFFVEGHKEVKDDPGVDVVADTTTLYVTIHGGQEDGPVVARGVIKISAPDFARQLRTLAARAPDGSHDLGAVAQFGRLFASGLWGTHGPGHGLAT